MRKRDCPHCRTAVPAASRFCPECGRPLEGARGGLDGSLRPGVAARWWPPEPIVLIGVLVAVGGVILLAGGEPAWGLVTLGAGLAIALARGRPRGRRAAHAVADLRARVAATREAMAARSREQVELFRARRELAELEAERARLFRELGHAVYYGDEAGTTSMRTAVAAVDERISEKEAEIEAMRLETEKRVQRAQAPVIPTERMGILPEPARVPEPWPPPDEGDLPEPAPTPAPGEPTPGPDEPAPPAQPPGPSPGSRAKR